MMDSKLRNRSEQMLASIVEAGIWSRITAPSVSEDGLKQGAPRAPKKVRAARRRQKLARRTQRQRK